MTQTANPVTLLASPLGEEGHEVAKGWTVVRMIMILNVDVTAEGGIIKLIAPSRGNERYEGKNSESYTSRTISAFSLFGGCRHHLALWEACHMIQKSKSRNADFILIAREGDTTTLGAKGPVKLKNPWAEGPSILRTFPFEPSEPFEPGRRKAPEPSHRRCVHAAP